MGDKYLLLMPQPIHGQLFSDRQGLGVVRTVCKRSGLWSQQGSCGHVLCVWTLVMTSRPIPSKRPSHQEWGPRVTQGPAMTANLVHPEDLWEIN